jgi:transcriptional regulator with XRE-family HTH domain
METDCAKFIKDIRLSMGMTQEQFARMIGVRRYNLAKYESGTVTPPGNIVLEVMAKKGRKIKFPLSK